ncbi:MAG: cytochrome c oxidase subunit 3 [Bacteroidota bacterium]
MGIENKSYQEKFIRSRKMMLWFGIISLSMTFAGLTSAYVVSSSRPDWLDEFSLPNIFAWSSVVIVLSSFSFIWAKRSIKNNNRSTANIAMWITLVLGIAFVVMQLEGFDQIVEQGYYFTGAESSITTSYIYVLVVAHLVHLAAGLIVLLVVIYNHFKKRYQPNKMLGFELGATFWHFVDILWLYLFFFLYFFG